ncbi:DUF4430 domain-containing protein [Carnobacterium gallinarum]|uniref:DUF4430 domain-containing protein n=1 Tax=Carnobacterium gallinarum TaxID=2749 RepID=UPI000552EF6E|nr:DUF4430 domain-containing protein [Carnobacterium gallinarum]
MKKRKIQIAVISLLTVLTFGGAFLNSKFAQVATSNTSETKTQAEKKVVKAEPKIDSKKIDKVEKEQEKVSGSLEKKSESLAESSKEVATETQLTQQDKDKATSSTTEASQDNQNQATTVTPNSDMPQRPVVEAKDEPTVPPSTPAQPEAPQPEPEVKPTPEPKKEVRFSIRGTVANSSSYVVSSQQVTISEGQSVMDILSKYCRDNGIQVGIRGGSYVAGINNLYEFDKGAESGWLYRVNGVFPSYGAAQYSVQVGDSIDWLYTENMGKDVGAPQV